MAALGLSCLEGTVNGRQFIKVHIMQKVLTLLSIALIYAISSGAFAANNYPITKYRCSKVSGKIDHLNRLLRAGYSGKQGERYRGDLRLLKKQRRGCKQKRFDIIEK